MLFKSYLKSSKKHISFCVNKSQNHTNRFGKASHFVLAIVMSDKSRTYIENRYYFYRLIFSNDLVTELCQKWAFECLSVVHRINRKSPVKR